MEHDPGRGQGFSGAMPVQAERVLWLGPEDMASAVPILALHQGLPELPSFGGVELADTSVLEERLTRTPRPCLVLSPLFWAGSDVMEVARVLSSLDYDGPYRVFSAPLPNPSLVEREVRTAFPELDFGLLELRAG
jgi:hypothetical protein